MWRFDLGSGQALTPEGTTRDEFGKGSEEESLGLWIHDKSRWINWGKVDRSVGPTDRTVGPALKALFQQQLPGLWSTTTRCFVSPGFGFGFICIVWIQISYQ